MSFQFRDGWRCQFLEQDLKTSLPKKLHFSSSDKIIESHTAWRRIFGPREPAYPRPSDRDGKRWSVPQSVGGTVHQIEMLKEFEPAQIVFDLRKILKKGR